MTNEAYIHNTKAKTGGAEYFQRLATEKGLAKHGEILSWLKSDEGPVHVTLPR